MKERILFVRNKKVNDRKCDAVKYRGTGSAPRSQRTRIAKRYSDAVLNLYLLNYQVREEEEECGGESGKEKFRDWIGEDLVKRDR